MVEPSPKSVSRAYREFFRHAHKTIRHAQGKQLADAFEIGDELGHGNFGAVVRVQSRLCQTLELAAKRIQKSHAEDAEALKNEVELLDRLDHPHIVRVYEAFEDDEEVALVMEFCSGGEIFPAELVRMEETRVGDLSSQVLGALDYMHGHGVCHRDLKPSNLLYSGLDRKFVKVADFGISKLFRTGTGGRKAFRRAMKSTVGTAGFWAPEVYFGEVYNERCDLWSLGVVVFLGLTAEAPFPDAGEAGVPDGPCEISPEGCSPEACEFLRALLSFDQAERPTARQAMEFALVKKHIQGRQQSSLKTLQIPSPVIAEALTALRRYAHAKPLRRLAAGAMARHVKGFALQQATKVFDAMDADKDGRISINTFRKILRQAPGVSEADVREIAAALEDNGYVDYIDFLAGAIGGRASESFREALAMLSVGDDETVSLEDLRDMGIEDCGPKLVKRLEGLAREDGTISLYQLAAMADSESSRSIVRAIAPTTCACLPCLGAIFRRR